MDELQPDDLDALLGPRPAPDDDPLRQAVLLQTTRLLRRRRRLKRLALIAAMAACYVAGMLTMRWWTPPVTDAGRPPGGQERVRNTSRRRPPAPKRSKPARRKQRRQAAPPENALALEWRAIDSKKKRANLYRRAGDRYLEVDHDIASALRCYRGALAAGPKKDWEISTHDNWLMMIAKQELQKEQSDAQNGG
jgi:hypothetical protein